MSGSNAMSGSRFLFLYIFFILLNYYSSAHPTHRYAKM